MSAEAPSGEFHSTAFADMREFVQDKHQSKPGEVKEFIFALAYTRYCEEKKIRLSRLRETGAIDSDHVKNVLTELCHQDEYKSFCEQAENRLADVENYVAKIVTVSVTGAVVDSLSPKFDELNYKIDSTQHKSGWWGFVRRSAIHGFEIVVAAVILLISYKILAIMMPILKKQYEKYLGDILTIFGIS